VKRNLPLTRADCENSERPCPYISCRAHTLIELLPGSMVMVNYPAPYKIHSQDLDKLDLDVLDRMGETCSLDVANRGEHTLEQVGEILRFSRQRGEQIEKTAREKLLRAHGPMLRELMEQADEPEV